MNDASLRTFGRSPRLLWVGQSDDPSKSVAAGDAIYDRKMIAGLRAAGSQVATLHPVALGRAGEVMNLARGRPYFRARYWGRNNRTLVNRASRQADMTLISWEPLDCLAEAVQGPAVVLLHNITGDALPRLYPGSRLAALMARRASAWERRLYRDGGLAGAGVVAERDAALLREIAPDLPICLLPPGMPDRQSLPAGAKLRRELVLSGTYDWGPKARDLAIFAGEVAGQGLPIWQDGGLPPRIRDMLRARKLSEAPDTALRFGVITDRFQSGHKLKSTAYLAANCVVLSHVDLSAEFAGIADAEVFVRRVAGPADIQAAMDALAAIEPGALVQRFLRFRSAVAERFSWAGTVDRLLKFCGEIPRDGHRLAASGVFR